MGGGGVELRGNVTAGASRRRRRDGVRASARVRSAQDYACPHGQKVEGRVPCAPIAMNHALQA